MSRKSGDRRGGGHRLRSRESQLTHLFDRFFRAAPPDVEGSGLGLAIVEAIAKRHGLAVKLENWRDRPGLVARVSFPETSKG